MIRKTGTNTIEAPPCPALSFRRANLPGGGEKKNQTNIK